MKRLIAVLVLLILAGCGTTGPVEIEGTDWCYIYDFRSDDNGFNIAAGSWEDGLGLLTDGSGDLIFSHVHDVFVEASFVIVTVKRPAGITGDIIVSAAGDIFGVSAGFTATLPGAMSTYPVVFEPGEIGLSGTSINVTANASQDLLLQSLEIRGQGGSPFPVNHCSDTVELTPGTDTPTPEFTYTATTTATQTVTRTPTATFTPSPTSDADWTCVYDFRSDVTGSVSYPQGDSAIYQDGIGWSSFNHTSLGVNYRTVGITLTFGAPVTLNSIDVQYRDVVWGTGAVGAELYIQDTPDVYPPVGELAYFQSPTTTGDFIRSWTGSYVTEQLAHNSTIASVFAPGDGGGELVIESITVSGSGTKPCDDGTPTPTPSPTITGTAAATATSTALAGWTCTFNFANNNGGWSNIFNAVWNLDIDDNGAWRAATTTPQNSLGIRYIATGVMNLTSVRVKGRTFGTRTDDDDELNFRTYLSSWSSYTQGSHDNTAFDRTYSYTGIRQASRIEVYLSVTQTNVAKTRIELVELRGIGGTNPCAAGTATATMAVPLTPVGTGTGTLTPRPLITSTPGAPTRTAIVIPTFQGVITGTFIPGTTTPGPTATNGTPSTQIPGEQIGDETGEIIGFSWEIGWGLFRTLFAWLQQVTDQIGGILTAFTSAPPHAIPGLPLCMTNPTAHDICAIYYIMDWTIFAPNTPGALIIPLVLIVMNFYIVVTFVRWVLRLVRRGENVTNVQ